MSENKFDNSTVLSKHEYETKKPQSFKRKRLIKVLATILIVALLGGLAAVSIKIKTPETSKSQEESSIELLSLEVDNVKEFTVKNNAETIEFVSGEGAYSWFIDGVDPGLTNSNEIYDLVGKGCKFFATEKIEDAKQDSAYGLQKPFLTLEITEKEKYVLLVGDLTANEDSRYVKLKGDEAVYVVPSYNFDSFEVTALSFASTSVVSGAELSEADENNQEVSKYFYSGLIQYFDECYAGGGSMDYSLKLKYNGNMGYKMVEPYNKDINPDSALEFLSIIKYGLTADGVYAYNQDNLKKYGLDNPIKIKITAADRYSVKLNIGKLQSDGYYPVTASGRIPVFKVKSSEFAFLFLDLDTYFSTHIISDSVSGFSKVQFSGSDTDSTYTFIKADEKDTTPKTKIDGKEIDFEQFRRLYKRVLGMASVELADGNEIPGDTVLRMVFDYEDEETEQKVLEIKKYTARKYLVYQSGDVYGIVTKTDVKNIINSAVAIKNGKEISDIEI